MKKIFQLSILVLFLLIMLIGCKNTSEKKAELINQIESMENQFDLSTQEGYESFLSEWGISTPENATFKELKKTNDGNYKLIYSIAPFENMQDSLQNQYEKMVDAALLNNGWIKPNAGWDPHGTLYEKGDSYFKFFILVSEQHNIYELAFKYGE